MLQPAHYGRVVSDIMLPTGTFVNTRACKYRIPCLDNYVQFVHFKRKLPSLANSDFKFPALSFAFLSLIAAYR